MNLNYPVLTDANRESYLKPGAVWESARGGWFKIERISDQYICSDRYIGTVIDDYLLYWPGSEDTALFAKQCRPVLPAYENAEQYYAALCELFGARHDGPEFHEWNIGRVALYLRKHSRAPQIWLKSGSAIAGHGEPPELAMWQQRVRCVHGAIPEAKHG